MVIVAFKPGEKDSELAMTYTEPKKIVFKDE